MDAVGKVVAVIKVDAVGKVVAAIKLVEGG